MKNSPQVGRGIDRNYIARAAVAALVATCVATAGCAGTFEVSGGPSKVRVQVRTDHILTDIRPLVAGDARATARADAVARRERRGKILLYTELALLVGCIGLTASNDPTEPTDTTYVGIGFCAATIGVGIAALIVTPKMSTYGQPLEVFNESHPATPFVAPKLGVKPAEPR